MWPGEVGICLFCNFYPEYRIWAYKISIFGRNPKLGCFAFVPSRLRLRRLVVDLIRHQPTLVWNVVRASRLGGSVARLLTPHPSGDGREDERQMATLENQQAGDDDHVERRDGGGTPQWLHAAHRQGGAKKRAVPG